MYALIFSQRESEGFTGVQGECGNLLGGILLPRIGLEKNSFDTAIQYARFNSELSNHLRFEHVMQSC